MVSEQESIFKNTVYLKAELQLLCNAYGVPIRKNDSRSKLAYKLVHVIKTCNVFPHPLVFNDESQSSEQSKSTANVTSQSNGN